MADWLHDDVLDAQLDYIADNGDKLFVCNAQPTNYTEASSTYALADHDLVVGDGNGDFTVANGDTSGRKLTLAQQADIEVDTTGSANHVAICDSGNTKVLAVNALSASQSITDGNTVTINEYDVTESRDAS